jgi:primase-polymerase (primpol)-like protein
VAADILAHLPDTYIEYFPSGSGLHIFLRGTLSSGGNRNSKTGVEMYSKGRYFTI